MEGLFFFVQFLRSQFNNWQTNSSSFPYDRLYVWEWKKATPFLPVYFRCLVGFSSILEVMIMVSDAIQLPHAPLEQAELLEDIRDFDEISAAIERGDEELIPAEVVNAILGVRIPSGYGANIAG